MSMTLSATPTAAAGGFSSFDFHDELDRAIAAVGYAAPRPIQTQTIPAVLAGRDVLGLAQTGTGKTAAFALPILDRLLGAPGPGPRALVVAPTRELATQIDADFRSLARFTHIRTVTVYGGVSDRAQIRELARRPEIVVACPGRLLDLHGQRALRLDGIETLVLDEADHMFDMGFLPDIRRILAALPRKRQNLLFSATMPAEIRGLAQETLHDPVVVELSYGRPVTTIEHALYPVLEKRKRELLEHLIQTDRVVSALVFTRTKHRARRLARELDKAGHRAVALQGNMSQNARDRAMKGFRSGRYDVLVATDIVARGIDVEQISHVFNFDVPGTPDAYTHRIGRTGRAERSGKAYTFVTPDDAAMVRAIERRLESAIPRCRVEGFEDVTLPETDLAPAARSASRPPRSRRDGGARRDFGGRRGEGRGRGGGRPFDGFRSRDGQDAPGRAGAPRKGRRGANSRGSGGTAGGGHMPAAQRSSRSGDDERQRRPAPRSSAHGDGFPRASADSAERGAGAADGRRFRRRRRAPRRRSW